MSYFRTVNGGMTKADDPLRLVWHSSTCSYWTDDWDKVTLRDGLGIGYKVAVCPHCGAYGSQMEVAYWEGSIVGTDLRHPGYKNFMNSLKGVCKGKDVTIAQLWAAEERRGEELEGGLRQAPGTNP